MTFRQFTFSRERNHLFLIHTELAITRDLPTVIVKTTLLIRRLML